MGSSVPLGHKLIAVVVAVATASGLYGFLRYREAQLAFSASLSFDSAVAEQLDPGITRAPDPAVVLGESILSDSVVARLVPQTDLAASSNAIAIGQFRARVELTQPTAGLLWVRYRDADPAQAAATANAVAKVLADGAPSTTSGPPPAVHAQPTPAPDPATAPASTAAPQHAPVAEPSLAASLGELLAQLSAAEHRAGSESSLRSDHDRQRYLESQVRAAQQRLGSLRSEFARSDSASGGQARVAAIQHALALFWPSAAGMNIAGTSEAQLRHEREQITYIIGVVEQQHQAAERAEVLDSASAHPPSQQTAPPAPQPQPAPVASAPPPPAPTAALNPLRLERMARLPAQVAWWPPVLIGFLCGLLYLGLAFARYHSSSEFDDPLDLSEETTRTPYRLITPDAPFASGSREAPVDAYPVETSSRRRAPFNFDPDPISASVPDQPPSPEAIQGSTDILLDSLPETAMVPTGTGMAETTSVANAIAPRRAPKEQDEVFCGTIVAMADPWGDEIRNKLSQTDIARTLDDLHMTEEIAAKGPARDEGPPPSRPGRLAG